MVVTLLGPCIPHNPTGGVSAEAQAGQMWPGKGAEAGGGNTGMDEGFLQLCSMWMDSGVGISELVVIRMCVADTG